MGKAPQTAYADAIKDSNFTQSVDENQNEIEVLEKHLMSLEKNIKIDLILEEKENSLSTLNNFDKKHIQAYTLQCVQTAIIKSDYFTNFSIEDISLFAIKQMLFA